MSEHEPLSEVVRPRLQALLDDLGSHEGADLHRRVLAEVERVLIEEVLKRSAGNRKAAAAVLGIHRNTLRVRMSRLGFSKTFFSTSSFSGKIT